MPYSEILLSTLTAASGMGLTIWGATRIANQILDSKDPDNPESILSAIARLDAGEISIALIVIAIGVPLTILGVSEVANTFSS